MKYAYFSFLLFLNIIFISNLSYSEVPVDQIPEIASRVKIGESCQHFSIGNIYDFIRLGRVNFDLYITSPKVTWHTPMIEFANSALNSVSPNPDELRIRPLAKNMAKFIGPLAVSKIINKLHNLDNQNMNLSNKVTLKDELRTFINETIQNDDFFRTNIETANNEIKSLENRLKIIDTKEFNKPYEELETQLHALRKQRFVLSNECTNPNKPPPPEKLKELQTAISSLDSQIKEAIKVLIDEKAKFETKKKEGSLPEIQDIKTQIDNIRYKPPYLTDPTTGFASKLVEAYFDERENNPHSFQHYTEKILLGIAYLNSNSANDFLKVYQEISDRKCAELNIAPHHTPMPVTAKDLDRFKSLTTDQEYIDFFLFLANQDINIPFFERLNKTGAIPILTYKGGIPYTNPETLVSTKISDCMETAILNFFAIGLLDESGKSFRISEIESKLKGYRLDPNLKEFFSKDPSTLNTQQAHEEWTKIVSNKVGINYVKKYPFLCELETTPENIIRIFSKLFLIQDQPDSALGHKEFFESNDSEETKMKKISALFSTKNRPIIIKKWRTQERELMVGPTLINWTINNRHSNISKTSSNQVSLQTITKLCEIANSDPNNKSILRVLNFVNRTAEQDHLNEIYGRLKPELRLEFLLQQDLAQPAHKLLLLKQLILENHLDPRVEALIYDLEQTNLAQNLPMVASLINELLTDSSRQSNLKIGLRLLNHMIMDNFNDLLIIALRNSYVSLCEELFKHNRPIIPEPIINDLPSYANNLGILRLIHRHDPTILTRNIFPEGSLLKKALLSDSPSNKAFANSLLEFALTEPDSGTLLETLVKPEDQTDNSVLELIQRHKHTNILKLLLNHEQTYNLFFENHFGYLTKLLSNNLEWSDIIINHSQFFNNLLIHLNKYPSNTLYELLLFGTTETISNGENACDKLLQFVNNIDEMHAKILATTFDSGRETLVSFILTTYNLDNDTCINTLNTIFKKYPAAFTVQEKGIYERVTKLVKSLKDAPKKDNATLETFEDPKQPNLQQIWNFLEHHHLEKK